MKVLPLYEKDSRAPPGREMDMLRSRIHFQKIIANFLEGFDEKMMSPLGL
ncbi:MAG: hypothetical protein R3C26_03325 [Calditrichia bacterium]